MSWTADFTVLALQASGIPVFREGNQFTIPSGSWSVVEACSGVRYLIASFMVGTLFAYLNYRSPRRRLIFAAISLAVPIVANWIRAYLIVLLGHLSGNTLAIGADHLIYGWLFFGLVIGITYATGIVWAEPEASIVAAAKRTSAPPIRSLRQIDRFWTIAATAVLIAITPRLVLLELGSADDTVSPLLTEVADLGGGWQLSNAPVGDWKPAFTNPSAQFTSTYKSQDGEVGVYIAYYRAQNDRRKLVSSANELVKSTDPKWTLVSTRVIQVPSPVLRVRSAEVLRLSSLAGPSERLIAWQVYWVGDRLTESDQWAKAYGALERLRRRGDDGAVIILYALDEPLGSARQSLELFAQTNLSAIVAQLRKIRDDTRASIAASGFGNPGEIKK
jgi:EpsI family protein